VATPVARATDAHTGWATVSFRVKVTVPVGIPEPGSFDVTVAVNVTAWPVTDEVALAERAVVVASSAMVCVADDVDPL